jgi:hypothetical protein
MGQLSNQPFILPEWAIANEPGLTWHQDPLTGDVTLRYFEMRMRVSRQMFDLAKKPELVLPEAVEQIKRAWRAEESKKRNAGTSAEKLVQQLRAQRNPDAALGHRMADEVAAGDDLHEIAARHGTDYGTLLRVVPTSAFVRRQSAQENLDAEVRALLDE